MPLDTPYDGTLDDTYICSTGNTANDAADTSAAGTAAPSPRATPVIAATIDGADMSGAGAIGTVMYPNEYLLRVSISDLDVMANKRLAITIPEGLRIVSYPGIEGTPLPPQLQPWITLENDAPVTARCAGADGGNSARFGTFTYSIVDTVTALAVDIGFTMDPFVFYGNMIMKSKIQIRVLQGGTQLNQHDISIAVQAASHWRRLYINAGLEYFAGIGIPLTSWANGHYVSYVDGNEPAMCVKYGSVTITYPANTTLDGVGYNIAPNGTPPGGETIYTGPGNNGSITTNPGARTVTFYYQNSPIENPFLILTLTSGNVGDKYDVNALFTFTEYDGTVTTYNQTLATFIVAEPFDNRLRVRDNGTETAPTDPNDPPGLSKITKVYFQNQLPLPLTNTLIRYTFPLDLHARVVEYPCLGDPAAVTGRYKVFNDPATRTLGPAIRHNVIGQSDTIFFVPANIGLAPNEYLEWIEANVGGFPAPWTQHTSFPCNCYGFVLPGTPNTTFYTTVRTSSADDANAPLSWTTPTNVVSTRTTALTIHSYVDRNASGEYSYAPGDTIHYRNEMAPNFDYTYYNPGDYGTIQRVANPIVIILLPNDVDIQRGSLSLKFADGTIFGAGPADVPYTLENATIADGRRVVRLHTQCTLGLMAPNGYSYPSLILDVSLIPRGNVKTMALTVADLVFISLNNSDTATLSDFRASRIQDTLDLNGNGNTTDYIARSIFPPTIEAFVINAAEEIVVDAGIVLPDGSFVTYNPDFDDTIIPIPLGESANYEVRITNNYTEPATGFTVYIPIPKANRFYGDHFQEPGTMFEWSVALQGAPIVLVGSYDITYSLDLIENNGELSASYKTVGEMAGGDWARVTMIKATSTAPIAPGGYAAISLVLMNQGALRADGYVDIFRPYFYYVTASFSGSKPGFYAAVSSLFSYDFVVDPFGIDIVNCPVTVPLKRDKPDRPLHFYENLTHVSVTPNCSAADIVYSIRTAKTLLSDVRDTQTALSAYAAGQGYMPDELADIADSISEVSGSLDDMDAQVNEKVCCSLNWLNGDDECDPTSPTSPLGPECVDMIECATLNACLRIKSLDTGLTAGVEFNLYFLDSPPVYVQSAMTDTDGVVQFVDLAAGSYIISRGGPDDAASFTLSVNSDGAVELYAR
ncbi:hypothetical protein FACS18948_5060 [Clostridia bacterium]|nr:hypothetical protein FACS18948_5060 [Clostridia bacterium]